MKRKTFRLYLLTLILILPLLSCQKGKHMMEYIGVFQGTFVGESGNIINELDTLLFVLEDCGRDHVYLAKAWQNTESGRLEIEENCDIIRDGNHIEGVIPNNAYYEIGYDFDETYWRNSILIIGEMVLINNHWSFKGEYCYDFGYIRPTNTESYHIIGSFEIIPR